MTAPLHWLALLTKSLLPSGFDHSLANNTTLIVELNKQPPKNCWFFKKLLFTACIISLNQTWFPWALKDSNFYKEKKRNPWNQKGCLQNGWQWRSSTSPCALGNKCLSPSCTAARGCQFKLWKYSLQLCSYWHNLHGTRSQPKQTCFNIQLSSSTSIATWELPLPSAYPAPGVTMDSWNHLSWKGLPKGIWSNSPATNKQTIRAYFQNVNHNSITKQYTRTRKNETTHNSSAQYSSLWCMHYMLSRCSDTTKLCIT